LIEINIFQRPGGATAKSPEPERTNMTRILIVEGHPDPDSARLNRALADAYAGGAAAAGHELRRVAVAGLDFPLLRSRREWEEGPPPPAILAAQEDVRWAQHIVFLYPLWLGDVPALLKAFLEQVARPGFAIGDGKATQGGLLKGRSARIIVTMGMPAFFYTLFFRAHSLKSLERNILKFAGMGPVRHTILGMVEGKPERRAKWLAQMGRLGSAAR
jgi:putative NADPH-quinone reductase